MQVIQDAVMWATAGDFQNRATATVMWTAISMETAAVILGRPVSLHNVSQLQLQKKVCTNWFSHKPGLPESPTLIIKGIVAELSTLTLLCQFSGYGLATLTWLRQVGQEVETLDLLIRSSRATVTSMRSGSSCPPTLSSTLQISEVTQADDGEYICATTDSNVESVRVSILIPSTLHLRLHIPSTICTWYMQRNWGREIVMQFIDV